MQTAVHYLTNSIKLPDKNSPVNELIDVRPISMYIPGLGIFIFYV